MKKVKAKKQPRGLSADPTTSVRQFAVLLCIVWTGLVLVHANKAFGFFPLIIPDEYTYISDTRHRPYSEALVPNYLYYALYSVTGLFGNAFLDAGRVLNAVFFMLSAPFLYAVAHQVCTRAAALALTLLILVSPISIMTAFFMPESLYFTAFWALAWFAVCRCSPFTLRCAAILGCGAGILALIKVHGVFLLPGMCLFILFQPASGLRKARFLPALWLCGCGLACFFAVRLGLGFLFAGQAGLDLLGTAYTNLASEGGRSAAAWSFLEGMAYNLLGNLWALGLLMGIPLAAAVLCMACPGLIESGTAGQLRRTALFAFSFVVPLILVSAGFCAMIAENYPDEAFSEISRILWRFYNFIFPMFLTAAAGFLTAVSPERFRRCRGRWLFFLPCLCGIMAAATGFAGYTPSALPDCPELGSLHFSQPLFRLFSAAAAVLSAMCIFSLRPALRLFLTVLLPLSALAGTGISLSLAMHGNGVFPDIYDKAGIFARQYLGRECSRLTVVSGFINSGKKSLIHIDCPDTSLITVFDGTVDPDDIPPEQDWLLLIGDFTVPAGYDKFSIVYDDPAQTEDLTALMRSFNNTRIMLRYTLMRITDFTFSADLAGGDSLWPVVGISRKGMTASVSYALPLAGSFRFAAAASAVCDPEKQPSIVWLPPGAAVQRLDIEADGILPVTLTVENFK